MYNSFVIRAFVMFWKNLQERYQYSFLNRMNNSLARELKRLSKGSRVVQLFISDINLVEESFLYGLYAKLIDGINKAFDFIGDNMNRLSSGSLVHTTIYRLFHGDIGVRTTFSLFLLTLGIGIVGVNLFTGSFSNRIYIVSTILIAYPLLAMCLKVDPKEALESSWVLNLIKGIFSIDEGVEQWW